MNIKLASIAFTVVTAAVAHAGGHVMLDDGQPWDVNDNYAAMNAVFGGDWTETNSSTPAASVFNSSNSFVWMLYSANSDSNGPAYLAANNSTIESWVEAGGDLFYMSAPWDYPTTVTLPGGETETFDGNYYSYASSNGYFTAAPDAAALENGPFGFAGGDYAGFYFSHAILTGSATALMTGDAGTVVAEESLGSGMITYATWTDPTFWYGSNPQGLLDNAVAHAAGAATTPSPAAVAPFLLGLVGAAKRRKR